MQIHFKDFLTVALSIELEVDRRVDIVLINHSKLVSHITLLVEEEMLLTWRAIHTWEVAILSRHAHKWRKLRVVLRSVLAELVHGEVLKFARMKRVLDILQLEMGQIKLEAHELLSPVMQVEVNNSGSSDIASIVNRQVQFEFIKLFQAFAFK